MLCCCLLLGLGLWLAAGSILAFLWLLLLHMFLLLRWRVVYCCSWLAHWLAHWLGLARSCFARSLLLLLLLLSRL
jgi:hypothetical protein